MKRNILIHTTLLLGIVLPAGLPLSAQETSMTLTLEDCRQMASSRSSKATDASLDVLAAEYQKQEAFSEYFPRVSAVSFGFHSLDPMLKIGITDIVGKNDFGYNLQETIAALAGEYGFHPYYSALQHGWGASVNVMQPVYAGGRIVAGNRLASLGVKAAELKRELSAREINSQTDEYYWQTVSLEEKLTTLESFKELLDTLCKDADAAYSAGLLTRGELLKASLKRNELLTGEVKLRSGIRLSKMNLLDAIGQPYCIVSANATESRPYIDAIKISTPPGEPESPEGLHVDEESVAASLEESELLALQLEAGRLEKRMEMGSALPELAVGASYGYSDIFNGGRFNGTAFATLKIPISDWWKTSRKMKRLDIQIEKTQADNEHLRSQLVLMVRKQWIDLNSAWDSYQLSLDAVQTAQAALDDAESNWSAGLVPLSDVLEAQAALRQEKNSSIDSLAEYRKALRSWRDISYIRGYK